VSDTSSLEERVAWQVACSVADVAKLPEWMQGLALGRDMRPLGDLAAPAVAGVLRDVLADVRARLVQAQVDVAGDGELDAWERGYAAATQVALTAIDKVVGRG
jgi:hypothetical protein